MRIDLNIPSFVSQHSNAAEKAIKPSDDAIRNDGCGAKLSLNAAAVASLSNSVSEIRQDRVAALRSAVESNTYNIQPEKIAEAMLSALSGWR